jgi:cell division protein FtsI/penicillin-binding protein 2
VHGPTYKSPLRAKPVVDVHGYDQLALWDVLVKSSNIGMTMLGERMGKENVYRALKSWNFGQQTGIELPGEDPGLIKPFTKWANSDLVSAVQGYSIMVTPLQLARGFCAYANGGHLVTPRIVQGVLDEDGNIISRTQPPQLKNMPQVIDPDTAAQVRRILCDVVIRGTATKARSQIWNIFGKTGTAHISAGGGYNEESFTSSFIGGAPYENPRLVIAMVIHDPERSLGHYGGFVSAPAASRTLERALAYLQVPASPDLPLPPPQVANVLYEYDAKLYQIRSTASAKE